MLDGRLDRAVVDDQTIALIAERVIGELRDDLELIVAELSAPPAVEDQLTVGQLARRLGVARSTVYAHWREWGGYKLGTGPKARIRFDASALPLGTPTPKKATASGMEQPARGSRRRRRRDLLVDAPRLARSLDRAV